MISNYYAWYRVVSVITGVGGLFAVATINALFLVAFPDRPIADYWYNYTAVMYLPFVALFVANEAANRKSIHYSVLVKAIAITLLLSLIFLCLVVIELIPVVDGGPAPAIASSGFIGGIILACQYVLALYALQMCYVSRR